MSSFFLTCDVAKTGPFEKFHAEDALLKSHSNIFYSSEEYTTYFDGNITVSGHVLVSNQIDTTPHYNEVVTRAYVDSYTSKYATTHDVEIIANVDYDDISNIITIVNSNWSIIENVANVATTDYVTYSLNSLTSNINFGRLSEIANVDYVDSQINEIFDIHSGNIANVYYVDSSISFLKSNINHGDLSNIANISYIDNLLSSIDLTSLGNVANIAYVDNKVVNISNLPDIYLETVYSDYLEVRLSSDRSLFKIFSPASNIFEVNASGDCTATTFTSISDKNLKNSIKIIENSQEILNNINGYTFKWNHDDSNDDIQYGFIAQEIEQVLPSLVKTNSSNIKSVDYAKICAILVQDNKNKHLQIQNLQKEVDDIKTKLDFIYNTTFIQSGV